MKKKKGYKPNIDPGMYEWLGRWEIMTGTTKSRLTTAALLAFACQSDTDKRDLIALATLVDLGECDWTVIVSMLEEGGVCRIKKVKHSLFSALLSRDAMDDVAQGPLRTLAIAKLKAANARAMADEAEAEVMGLQEHIADGDVPEGWDEEIARLELDKQARTILQAQADRLSKRK